MSPDELLEKKKNEKQATPHTRKEQQMKQLRVLLGRFGLWRSIYCLEFLINMWQSSQALKCHSCSRWTSKKWTSSHQVAIVCELRSIKPSKCTKKCLPAFKRSWPFFLLVVYVHAAVLVYPTSHSKIKGLDFYKQTFEHKQVCCRTNIWYFHAYMYSPI